MASAIIGLILLVGIGWVFGGDGGIVESFQKSLDSGDQSAFIIFCVAAVVIGAMLALIDNKGGGKGGK